MKPKITIAIMSAASEIKREMSGLEIKVCVDELKDIEGSWTGKVYQIDDLFLFKINSPGGGEENLVIEPGVRIHLTSMKYDTPREPPSFAMLLRKHLQNSKLMVVHQPDLERIVEVKFEGKDETRYLIAELFGSGNLVLCNGDREIIKPQKAQSWEHREIVPGEVYNLPPKRGKDITSISRDELAGLLADSPDIVRGLARNLNIGGDLAEEICARSGLEKDKGTGEISDDELDEIFEEIRQLFREEINPKILYKNGKPVDFVPFDFETKSHLDQETHENFNQTIDNYFRKISEARIENKREKELEKRIEETESRLRNQVQQVKNLKSESKMEKRKADEISQYHEEIDWILENVNSTLEEDGWERAEEIVKESSEEGKKWAKPINGMQPNQGKIKVGLPETEVELDIRKSSFENASEYYEKYKKAKNKIEGAKKAVEETRSKLGEIKEEGIERGEEKAPKKKRKREWYEKYRWFFSSDEFLVIAGRDKRTNQEVVEKHMEKSDKYLHADIDGAPHTVIKGEERKIPESTIKEAAEFAAMHSSAWGEGLGNMEVYTADPDQVTKEAPAGEYLPEGSYMIKGERNYLTVPVAGSVGLFDREGEKIPMCGPSAAVEKHSNIVIGIKPGPVKKSDLSKRIMEKLEGRTEYELSVDRLMQILPPGPGTIVDS